MENNELSESNFKRICLINWALTPLLMLFFGWPYIQLSLLLHLNITLTLLGMLFFSFSFAFTILHGHVTMALGALHRHVYYTWLSNHSFSYGLGFHKVFIRTRTRLFFFIGSMVILAIGFLGTV